MQSTKAIPAKIRILTTRMESSQVEDLLSIFNVSGTGSLSKQEFVFCWNEWIKKASVKNALVGVIQAVL